MITISTADLTGILADVTALAHPDDEVPTLNCVRLEWDGRMLSASATDRIRLGISSWHPDDEPEVSRQEDLLTRWGGADNPWSITVPLADAKDLVKVFRLGISAKEQWSVPLTVDLIEGRIKVVRHRDTGHSAVTVVIEDAAVEHPNLRELLAKNDAISPVKEVAFTAALLADFARVRPRGPMELMFTGPESLCHVAIGERFVGAIAAIRRGAEQAAA